MHIIKLPAIDSTNSYLKELTTKQTVENFTVVVAENQTNGRGQRGAAGALALAGPCVRPYVRVAIVGAATGVAAIAFGATVLLPAV